MNTIRRHFQLRFSLRVFLLVAIVLGVAAGLWGRRYVEDFTTEMTGPRIGKSQARPQGFATEMVFRTDVFGRSRQLEFLLIIPERSRISVEGGDAVFSPDQEGIDRYGRRLYLDGERVHIDSHRPILVVSDRLRQCLAFPTPPGIDLGPPDENMSELVASDVWRQQILPAIEAEEQYNRENRTNSVPRKEIVKQQF